MTAVSGGPFTLTRMDLADTYNSGLVDDVEFLFTFADNTTLSSLATLDSTPGLQPVTFLLSNLISAEWTVTSGNFGPQVDNLVADVSGVPVPAALPLFVSAFAAFGLIGWKRRGLATS